MTNRIRIFGHLGKDCESKDVKGKRILILSVASNQKIKGDDVTVWRRVTFWDDNYGKMEKYLTKGSAVMVGGEEMPPRIYEGKVQLEVIGKDLSFNPFGGKKKPEGTEAPKQDTSYVAQPKQDDPGFPGF